MNPRLVGVTTLVAAATLTTVACGVTTDSSHDTRTFADPGTTLAIDDPTADLQLVPTDSDLIQGERWLTGSAADDSNSTWELSGHTLHIGVHCAGIVLVCGTRYQLGIPKSIAVTVTTSAGNVTISKLSNSVAVMTTSGHVQLTDLSGRLVVNTSAGDVDGVGLQSQNASITTDAGDLTVSFAQPPSNVKIKAVHRDATLTLPTTSTGYHIDVSTANPNMSARSDVPDSPASPRHVNVSSTDGNSVVLAP